MNIPSGFKSWKTKSGYTIIRVLSGRSKVFLLSNGDKNILVDTSTSRLWNKLLKQMTRLDIHQIDCLVITHAHFDHAGNARKVKDHYHPQVLVHKDEASALAGGDYTRPEGTMAFSRLLLSLGSKKLNSILKFEPCPYDLLVDTLFNLHEFGFNATIIHTPGHTPGSMSVIVDDEIAIVGDAMFGVFPGSVFPPFANDVSELVSSWGKLLATGCTIFLPAHGSENRRELVETDYKKRNNRDTES